MDYSKPILLVSACLGFKDCDYHGKGHKSLLVEDLKNYADLRTVCPESGMGLPAPRPVMRIVQVNGENRLLMPQTGDDLTEALYDFSSKFLGTLTVLDGCILKNRSPTCGIRDVKIYGGIEADTPIKKSKGLFSSDVERRFQNVLIEDEGRLTSIKIRENFLTVVFTKADFRRIKEGEDSSQLLDFHKRNKFLFMAYNRTRLKEMDGILKQKDLSFEALISHYEIVLNACLNRMPRIVSHKNALDYTFRIFSNQLEKDEIEYFNSRLSLFEEERLPLSAMITLIRSYILRFSEDDLAKQTYFSPYPEGLNTIRDSKK